MVAEPQLQDDLNILQNMYPELQIELDLDLENINEISKIQGTLPFTISLAKGLKIRLDNQELVFEKLIDNILYFEVNRNEHCNLWQPTSLNIRSPWITMEDRRRLKEVIRHEFDDISSSDPEVYEEFAPVMMLIIGYLTDENCQLLFQGQERICKTQDEFESFIQLYHRTAFDEMASKNFDCSICMEIKKGDRMVKLPCNHVLCLDCAKSYYTSMIEQASIDKIKCVECKYEPSDLEKLNNYEEIKRAIFTPLLLFEIFHGILSPQTCDKYQSLFHEQPANKLSNYCTYSCVSCTRCNYWCVKEDLDEPMIRCPKCEFTFCFDCLHSWHGYNNVCGKKFRIPEDVVKSYVTSLEPPGLENRRITLEAKYGRRILEMEAKAYLSDKLLDEAVNAKDSNLQRCPRCRIVVQRSEGCNKMKCTVCCTPFCYICGEMLYIEDPYEHFRNPLSKCYAKLFEGMPGTDS